MSKALKNTLIVGSLLILFYLSIAYELKGSFICNIFNPAYYSNTDVIYKLLFSIAVVVITFLFAVLIQSKYFRDSKLLKYLFTEKAFLIFMLVVGTIISILIPLYQIPDESTHITMIYEELGLNASFSTYFGLYSDTMSLINNLDARVNIFDYFGNDVVLNMPAFTSAVSISLVRHFPQAMGLIICSFFNCSVIVTSIVCETLAVIFSAVICYFALKLMPSRKLLFAAIMALPLCIQQNGSFSYDVVLVPLCFLLFAFILNIKIEKEKFKTTNLLFIIILVFIIAIIKIPYIIIAACIFLIPSKKFSFKFFKWEFNHDSWLKYRKFILPAFIIIAVLAAFMVLKMTRGNVFINLFLSSVINLPHSIKLIAKFVILDLLRIWSSYMWDFCWLNIAPSIYYLLFIIVSVFVFNFIKYKTDKNPEFKIWEHIYIFVIFTVCFYVITISMVEHTLFLQDIDLTSLSLEEFSQKFSQIDRILGLQGRYFIPILPLLCFSFRSKALSKLFNNVNYKLYSPIYFSVICVYMVVVMLTRFWI